MSSNQTTPQPRYGIWIALFLIVGAFGIYYARKIDARNDQEAATLRAVRKSVPDVTLAAAPADWPRISLGPVSLCLPVQADVRPPKEKNGPVVLERPGSTIMISDASTVQGREHLVRFRARYVSFPRDWDEVDARAAIHAFSLDSMATLTDKSSKEMAYLNQLLVPSIFGTRRVETFRNNGNIKGILLSAKSSIEIQYWSLDEATRGVLQVFPNTPENQILISDIISSLRVENTSSTSRPADNLPEECRRLLLTSRPA